MTKNRNGGAALFLLILALFVLVSAAMPVESNECEPCCPPCTCVCPTATATVTVTPVPTWTLTSSTLTIIHQTDVHIGQSAICAQRLPWIVNAANQYDGAVLVDTGDCTETGTSSQWQTYQQIMAGLELPWRAVPGNHDTTWPLGDAKWVWDVAGYRLIGLNNRTPTDWAWLDSLLAGAPTVLFGHYPPDHGHYGGALWSRISRPNVLAYVHGHLHYAQVTYVNGTPVISGPRACLANYTVLTVSSSGVAVEFH